MKIDKILHIIVILAMAIIMVASSVQAVEPVFSPSQRLIVELETPPLAEELASVHGSRLEMRSVVAQNYLTRLKHEQDAFILSMRQVYPNASVSYYINEQGESIPATYQVVFNGLSIDLGQEPRLRNNLRQARQSLAALPGVKQVYAEQLYKSSLYTTTALINAPLVWNSASIGGQNKAGAGIKIASIDAGLSKDAPMFNGTGYSYPAGFPAKGLGAKTDNNNGKIIASRVYFRSWDPPLDGEATTWPGPKSSAHGNHTASIAGGNVVSATYHGVSFPQMSGVAPKAWLMSYRVDYASTNYPDGNFYPTEIILAIEDAVKDGADIINNSWESVVPTEGGDSDPLDKALINASKAGVFIAQAAGNRGPDKGTLSAPSPEIMTVANSSSTGNIVSGGIFDVSAPLPVLSTLQNLPFAPVLFGPSIPSTVLNYKFVTAEGVDPNNIEGCEPWQPDALKGLAVVIKRGQTKTYPCTFGAKTVNAEQAGAVFVIIYNNIPDNEAGGGLFTNAGPSDTNTKISTIIIKNSDGLKLVDWFAKNGQASQIKLINGYTQIGNAPDRIAKDSGRGPGIGNVLKPDMAAPGTNILAQGDLDGLDVTKHVVYSQVSGTSQATPHVAGAAALLKQIHPDWSNMDIKSALMSTAKYMEIYNHDSTTAQPLDMGAGRLDLTHAADPGVILNPPNLSYGLVTQGMTKSIQVKLRSVADKTETYAISTLYTGSGFTATTALPGFTVSPATVTVAASGTAVITITFDSATSKGVGDNQGYVILKGTSHEVHLPAWARVTRPDKQADILLLDNDGSGVAVPPADVKDFQKYYTDALNKIGASYQVWDIDAKNGTIPTITDLLAYKTVIYFTGDNRTITLSKPNMNLLAEYLNSGGSMIAMGQNLAAVLGSNKTDGKDGVPFFYDVSLGANWLQDSVSGNQAPTRLITATQQAPLAFQNITIDVFADGDGASQNSIDEFTGQPSIIDVGDPGQPLEKEQYVSLFGYPGDNHKQYTWVYGGKTQYIDGVVGTSNRMQPSFERPNITYRGRSIYTSFGLEGVNNSESDLIKREDLLKTFLNWAWDEPQVTINSSRTGESNLAITLEAKFSSPITGTTDVNYRWDFGDNTPIQTQKAIGQGTMTISHTYTSCGRYPVRVEVTDSYGNRVINSHNLSLGNCQTIGSAGGVITFTNAVSSAILLNIPPNSGINDNSSIIYEPITSTHTTPPKGLSFTGITFTIELLQNGKLISPIFTFPITATIYYNDTDIAGLDESSLVLRYWRSAGSINEWSDKGITNVITPSNHRLVVRLTHFSEFAMFGQPTQTITITNKNVYLPVLVK